MDTTYNFDNTIILGAGLSGLGAARVLPGARIFEASDHPGGHAWSHNLEGVHFDQGAHICHSKDQSWIKMISDAAMSTETIEASSVSNFWKGQWIGYPVQNNLVDLKPEMTSRALKDIFQAQSTQHPNVSNYKEWCLAQYGPFLSDTFYRAYTNKYWRVPMEDLGTDWLGGRLLPSQAERIIDGALGTPQESQAVFAKFLYPSKGGFFSFFRTLYDGLGISYGAKASEISLSKMRVSFTDGRSEPFENLVSSIPLPDLIKMIPEAPSHVRDAAAQLRHLQMLCVNILVNKSDISPHHWFYIYDEDVDVARVKVMSNVAPAAIPEGCTALQCEIFRRMDEPMDVDALADKALEDMGRILGFHPRNDVRNFAKVYCSHSYVISDLRREKAVSTITFWLEQHRISPIGLYGQWRFIWSDAAYLSGATAGIKIRPQ